jgi:hypothetical protein
VATLNSQINRSKNQNYKPWGTGSNQLTYQDMVDKRNAILNAHPEITLTSKPTTVCSHQR